MPCFSFAAAKNLTAAALTIALAGIVPLAPTGTGVAWAASPHAVPAENSHLSSKPAQIAFDIPRTWVIDDEQTLFEQGFIVPPEPLYAVVASPGPLPSHYAFNPSSTPWLFVTAETDDNLLPPSQLYELAPEYLQYLANDSPGSTTTVKSLEAHHVVQQGGLSGSAAALIVAAPGGATSIDEVAYEKGDRLWLMIAGCSVSCYDHNRSTITQIVRSLRVGAAA
jgi:hypothetical protein